MDEKKLRDLVQRIILIKLAESGERFVPVASSNRHVHLSQRDVDMLFSPGYRLEKLRDLSQPGQYACKETVTLQTPKGKLALRILGPVRRETQVELSIADTIQLGLQSVIRMSGDVSGTPGGLLINGDKSVQLKQGIIVAVRHLHVSPGEAQAFGVKDGDFVSLVSEGLRPCVFRGVAVRVDKSFVLEAHIDRDEANAAALKDGALCRLILENPGLQPAADVKIIPVTPVASTENKLIVEEDIIAAHKSGAKQLTHTKNAIITPLARDAARKYGVELLVGGSV